MVTGGNRAKLHDVGCHIICNACCEAGFQAQREVIVPMLATENLTKAQVDVDTRRHLGLPHARIDFKVVDEGAFHYSCHAERVR